MLYWYKNTDTNAARQCELRKALVQQEIAAVKRNLQAACSQFGPPPWTADSSSSAHAHAHAQTHEKPAVRHDWHKMTQVLSLLASLVQMYKY